MVRFMVTALVALTIGIAAEAAAQEVAAGRTFVAIAESFPDIDARAMLVREPGVDLVVLREEEATVAALTMALLLLREVRERYPLREHGQMYPITGFVVTQEVRGQRRRALEDALARLTAAETVDLGTFGPGRRVPLRGR